MEFLTNICFVCFAALLSFFSCQMDRKDISKGDNVEVQKTIESLQHNVDSLRTQIQLCRDTISEQRMRLNKIKTILEPLIQ